MACLGKNPSGSSRILFVDHRNGKRISVNIGKASPQQANFCLAKIELLLTARRLNQPPAPEAADWLGKIGDSLYVKLVRFGLAPPRKVDGIAGDLTYLIPRKVPPADAFAPWKEIFRENGDELELVT